MNEIDEYYPPTPPGIPPDLAKPTGSYRVRVVVVLTSLILFALLYVGLVGASGYFCYWCFASLDSTDAGETTTYQLLRNASNTEQRIGMRYSDLIQRMQRKEIDREQFLASLENNILPEWREERHRLAQANVETAREQEIVDLYERSFALQEDAWDLLARAVREKNSHLAVQSSTKSKESESLARQFDAQAQAFFSSRSTSPSSGNSNGVRIIVGILLGLLFLFLVKGFFKRRQPMDTSNQIELTEQEQPKLFAFIRRLCQDTRAPFPRRVYVTPDVNAAVFYDESLFNLFLPTQKNLLVGFGLINQLNITEFKAVLAHEFGHFSQNSMKLGSYVYMSNGIIGELVYGRDWFDTMLAHGRATDIRIAVFAWGVTGVVWVLRKSMQGLFRVINFANSALSRQMEFNADLVAVSVTGSDALVHGLTRLNFANDCLGQAWTDLTAAADHNLYSRDLFYHQTQAAAYLRAKLKEPELGKPPELPDDPTKAVQVFHPEDTGAPKMWATHPSNYDRELNAKDHYFRSPIDERSPWILFGNAAGLREQVTRNLYRLAKRPEDVDLQDPEAVQGFIDDEHAETTYDPRYHGLYDQRYIKPGKLNELRSTVPSEFANTVKLAEAKAQLYGKELETRMKVHKTRHDECNKLVPLAHGAVELTGKDFQFRGERYTAAQAKKLLDQLQKEMDEDFAWMHDLDRQVFLVHYAMASQLDSNVAEELENRYDFHLELQTIHDTIAAQNDQVQAVLGHLSTKPDWTMEEFQGVVVLLREAHDLLAKSVEDAQQVSLPELKNMTAGDSLGAFMLSKPLLRNLRADAQRLDGEWIGEFLEQMAEAMDKCQRIHFKSLGAILALQERIDREWETKQVTATASGT